MRKVYVFISPDKVLTFSNVAKLHNYYVNICSKPLTSRRLLQIFKDNNIYSFDNFTIYKTIINDF